MSIQDNKRIVADYLARFGRADIQGVLAVMADDATWWVNGRPELYPDAGTRTKAEMAEAWRELYELLDGPLTMDPLSMVAEDDHVAAEVRSQAVTKTGRVYENYYHMLFTIRDGKIFGVREYTDLLHPLAVFARRGTPKPN
jgi:ketosteroid isomerase-like protein